MSRGVLLAVLLLAELSIACGTSSNAPSSPTPTPTASTGSLQVGVSGGDVIPGTGYTVTVDEGTSQTTQTDASVTFSGLSAGEHSVALALYSTRCSAAGANPRKVPIVAGATARTDFEVMCSVAAPTTRPSP